MNDKYSIPGAIVLAGIVIAGAILFARAPVQRPSASATPIVQPPVAVATPAAVLAKIEFRPVEPSRDHIRGDVNAPITLIEYSDLECPFCKIFHASLQQVLQEYPGKVRWVYRHFPLAQLHPKAAKEAEAAECAGDKFWEFVDGVFAVTPSNDGLDPAELPKIARRVGLDVPAFEKCVSDGAKTQLVQEDLADAEKAGGQGTPYTVIVGPNGETVPFSGAQPYPSLKAQIDALLGTAS